MREKQKARPGMKPERTTRDRKLVRKNLDSKNYTRSEFRIVPILPHGAVNAISAGDLKKIMGFSDTRTIRAMVERERLLGAPILSGDEGYFLPSDDPMIGRSELEHFVHRNRARRRSNYYASKWAEDLLKAENGCGLDGQTVIDDFDGDRDNGKI